MKRIVLAACLAVAASAPARAVNNVTPIDPK